MTSKERMLCALKKGKPDRLPVTIHQWQPYHLNKYMNGMTDICANKSCGLDASINYFEVEERKSKNWKIESHVEHEKDYYITKYRIETPEGVLTTSEGTNPMTTWVMEPLIKEQEDILLLKKYRPIPVLNKEGAEKTYDSLGEDGILRTFIWGKQGGCWQDACELYGVENMILATYDDPDWVHEFLTILLEQKTVYMEESLKNVKFDLVETGGGASSNTVISPGIHEEFCLPYDRKMHDMLHELGFLTTYHTCGGMTKIADLIAENHCDASETLSPVSVGGDISTPEDRANLYSTLHEKVALIGGMDQFHILEGGSKQEIFDEVRTLFESFGKNGGYILSACDHFFEVPPENLKLFAEAAKEFQY